MRSRISSISLALSLVVLCLFLGTGADVYGQGRGHRDDRGGGRQGGGPEMQRGGGGQRPQNFNPPQRQQRMESRQIQRPMPQQNRNWQMPQRAQQPRQQWQQNRSWQTPQRAQQPRQQQQQNRSWENRGWQRQDRAARIDQPRIQQRDLRIPQQQRGNIDRGQNNARWQQEWRDRPSNRIATNGRRQSNQSEAPWVSTARAPSRANRGQEMRGQFAQNQPMRGDQPRRDLRDNNWFAKRSRNNRFDRHDFGRRGFDRRDFGKRDFDKGDFHERDFGRRDFDRDNSWEDVRRGLWRDNILRNAIVNVAYGYQGSYYDYYPRYDSYYYGVPYNTSYFTVNYFVYPQYLSYYGYPADPSYYDYPPYPDYVDPYYSSYYDPYGSDNYDPYYEYPAAFYYDYQPFAYYTQAGYPDPFSNYEGGDYCSLPSNSYFDRSLAANFGQLLASGYDQGYSDGLYARRENFGDRYYYDPYVYAEIGYDPYSYSLGENRHCLSEGYQLGYRDALNGTGGRYDPLNDGNVDLISLLLGNELRTINFPG